MRNLVITIKETYAHLIRSVYFSKFFLYLNVQPKNYYSNGREPIKL